MSCRDTASFSPSDRSVSPKPEGVRRRLTGAPAAVWRSRADDPAGTDGEPKGAMVLPVLPSERYCRRKSTEKNSRQMMYRTDQDVESWQNDTRRTERGGASARPVPFAPQGRHGFRGAKGRVVPCPAYGYAASLNPCKNLRMAAIRRCSSRRFSKLLM